MAKEEEEVTWLILIGSRRLLFWLTLLLLSFIFPQPPHRGAEAALPPAPCPSHSLRRLPQCPPVHLSHPVPLSVTLSLSTGPGQPRPPVPPPHRAPPPHIHVAPRGASFRNVSHHNSCRMVMVSKFPVSSVGNILFNDVTWCNFSTGSRELLHATKPKHLSRGMFTTPLIGCCSHFHRSFVSYKSICMLTVMHSLIK